MRWFYILIFTVSTQLFSQTDWHRWEAADLQITQQSSSHLSSNTSKSPVYYMQKFYSLTISDYDGDNCPFSPTCSAFFVQAVNETNFVEGMLMFADRFTRDTNLFKDYKKYPINETGKLYDPVQKYIFEPSQ